MERREVQRETFDLILGWGIEIIPMLNVAAFEFIVETLDASGKQHPKRHLEPMAISLGQLKKLHEELPRLISTMEQMGVRELGKPLGTHEKN